PRSQPLPGSRASRRAPAWSNPPRLFPLSRSPAFSPAFIDDPPDPPRRIVGDVQRPVRPLRQSHGPVLRPGTVLVPEPVGERLVGPHRFAVLERDEHDAIARLRQRRAVPGAVKRDEYAPPVGRGELRARVKQQAVRRPVAGERECRLFLLGAPPYLLAVAPVLRREHEVAELEVVIAVRPPEIVPLIDAQQLLRRLFRALLGGEKFWPVLEELVATVLRGPQLAVRRDHHPHGVANPRGVMRP